MLDHKVNREPSKLFSESNKVEGEKPGTPINLTGESRNSGADLFLTWDAPTSGGSFFLYELALDGVVFATTAGRSYLYTGIVTDVEYEFKVRCIGAFGIRGDYSDVFDWVGDGLPVMSPKIDGGYRSAILSWSQVEDNQDFTINGYNVYLWTGAGFEKQNASLLDVDVLSYTQKELGVSEFVRMAVSFEYNTTEESDLYEAETITHSGPGGSYIATLTLASVLSQVQRFLVSPKKTYQGVLEPTSLGHTDIFVREGADVTVIPLTNGSFSYNRQWGTSMDVFYELRYGTADLGKLRYSYDSGCANGVTFVSNNMDPFRKALVQALSIRFGRIAVIFAMLGPPCEGLTNEGPNIEFSINFDPEDYMGRYRSSSNSLQIKQTPQPDNDFAVDLTGDDAAFTWTDFIELDGYNIYLSKDGGEYEKHNAEVITGTSYTAENLAVGEYNAFLTFVKHYSQGDYETAIQDLTTPVNFEVV